VIRGSLRAAIAALWASGVVTLSAAAKPNVVIFLADDAGWGDYSHNGNTMVRTPHIDSIARGGVTLDRFFAAPVCSPTRAEFLTGRYYPRGGVRGVSSGHERLNLDEKTIADAFKAAGYATGAFGKWHNGSQWPYHPMARGFDEYFGYTSGHWGDYFDAPLEHNGVMVETKGYIVDVCTDRAIEFIERNRARPFFCYLPLTTPHTPWAVPTEYWDRFKTMPITQPAAIPAAEKPDQTRCALAMIANQDWNVGRVLAKLEECALSQDTIVFFFSDNGPNSPRWNGGMKGGKGSTDEGGVRVPGYLRWPAKIPAGRTVRPITGAIDLLPTLTALAGIPRVGTKPLDGRDISPLLLNPDAAWPDRMIFSTWGGRVSVRTQRYRLDAQGALFDLQRDAGQASPMTAREPQIAAELMAAVKAWRGEVLNEDAGSSIPARQLNNIVDPRPLPVGYPEFPLTMLPARDGEPRGGVKRSGSAPNSSYFVNWTSRDGELVWKIEVNRAGRYAVTIDYTCPIADAGSLVELSFQDRRLTGRVTPGWDPPLNPDRDVVPRVAAESRMKPFRSLKLGEIELPRSAGPLTLRALEIPGRSVMDVRRVSLTLLK
jgi:arylsulfatase A-like enzyme